MVKVVPTKSLSNAHSWVGAYFERMDELETFLKSTHLDLDTDDDDNDELWEDQDLGDLAMVERATQYRRESTVERESRTQSILSQDVLVPNIVRFSSSHSLSYRKRKRQLSGLLAVILSIMGIHHFSKIVLPLYREKPLDIDASMKAAEGLQSVNATSNTTISSTGHGDRSKL